MTYWALNAVFLGAVAIVVAIALLVRRGSARRLRLRAVGIALAVLLAMTAVFDNAMIAVGLVAYDPTRISGAFIGIAPLEDFAYAIAAAVLLPALWTLLPARSAPSSPAASHPASDGARG